MASIACFVAAAERAGFFRVCDRMGAFAFVRAGGLVRDWERVGLAGFREAGFLIAGFRRARFFFIAMSGFLSGRISKKENAAGLI
jgi:hypothetical protein